MNFIKLMLLAVVVSCSTAFAESVQYPQRPVRMLVPVAPGGGVDIAARVMAQKFTQSMGQQVVVDNRGGGGGNIAMTIGARSQPDGYTLVMSGGGPIAVNKLLYHDLQIDPIKDFAPVALVASTTYVLVLNPSSKIHSIGELITSAKATPGKLTFASAGTGTPMHLTGELFKLIAKIDIIHVPYRGAGPALNDLLGSQVTMMFGDLIAATPHIKENRLRALAVGGSRRTPVLPGLPTIAESGLPGFASSGWTGLIAPVHTPTAIIKTLNAEVNRALSSPEVKTRLNVTDGEFGSNTPEQFEEWIRKETAKWAGVIKSAGVKVE